MPINRQVLATKQLVDKKLPVMYMYREISSNGDSGWTFLAGNETQEYLDNPNNINIYDIQTIIDIDGSIVPYLDSKPGSAYERSNPNEPFVSVDFKPFVYSGHYVLATKFLVDNKLPVRFMYREKSTGNDSGWRLFAGTETQEYVDDPNNIGIYDLQTILGFDKSILPYLDSPSECAYVRNNLDDTFSVDNSFDFSPEGDESK